MMTIIETTIVKEGIFVAAKEKKIPLSVISEGLGHDSEQTTRIYLTSLDIAEINRANNLILKSLQKD